MRLYVTFEVAQIQVRVGAVRASPRADDAVQVLHHLRVHCCLEIFKFES